MVKKIYLVVPNWKFWKCIRCLLCSKMGLSIEKLLVASNENNILTEWINTEFMTLEKKS